MYRRFSWTLALCALVGLVAAGVAVAEKPITVQAGNLRLTFNGGVKPKALSKTKLEPVSLNVQGKIESVDGSHPPPLTELVIDTDKNGTIDVQGVPTCRQGQLEARTTKDVEGVCGPAILGSGTTDIELLFAESKPVTLHSKLLALNGGTKGGTTTIFVHAYLSSPVTAAVVTTVKITKEHKGRYGTHSVALIPKIANYAGSLRDFEPHLPEETVLLQRQEARLPHGQVPRRAFRRRRLGDLPRRDRDRPGEDHPDLQGQGLRLM